jgi:hypothetical protein
VLIFSCRAPLAQLDRASGYEPKVGSSNLSGRTILHIENKRFAEIAKNGIAAFWCRVSV